MTFHPAVGAFKSGQTGPLAWQQKNTLARFQSTRSCLANGRNPKGLKSRTRFTPIAKISADTALTFRSPGE